MLLWPNGSHLELLKRGFKINERFIRYSVKNGLKSFHNVENLKKAIAHKQRVKNTVK